MYVSDLKDGDVPAETLQRSTDLATFEPLLGCQALQLLMKLHRYSSKHSSTAGVRGQHLLTSSLLSTCPLYNSSKLTYKSVEYSTVATINLTCDFSLVLSFFTLLLHHIVRVFTFTFSDITNV